MTATPPHLRPPAGYAKIGDGEHSEVFRRGGSRYCIQLFRPDTPLTVERIETEYAYLQQAYSALPRLIPRQRLFTDNPHAPLAHAVLVKQWVEVDTSRPLHLLRANDLTPATLAQLNQFVAITRSLLDRAPTEETLLPDIIDNRFRNLALDTAGQLRLLDTNQLINTHALRALAPGRHLDLTRRPIHAMVLRRLMFLDAAFRGRTCDQLTTDPVYARYLTPAGFDILFQASAETGEPCGGTHEAATAPPRLWHHR